LLIFFRALFTFQSTQVLSWQGQDKTWRSTLIKTNTMWILHFFLLHDPSNALSQQNDDLIESHNAACGEANEKQAVIVRQHWSAPHCQHGSCKHHQRHGKTFHNVHIEFKGVWLDQWWEERVHPIGSICHLLSLTCPILFQFSTPKIWRDQCGQLLQLCVGSCAHPQQWWCLWSSHFKIHCKQQQQPATTTTPWFLANWTVSSQAGLFNHPTLWRCCSCCALSGSEMLHQLTWLRKKNDKSVCFMV